MTVNPCLRFARWRVDGIISDDTELLVRTLGLNGGWTLSFELYL